MTHAYTGPELSTLDAARIEPTCLLLEAAAEEMNLDLVPVARAAHGLEQDVGALVQGLRSPVDDPERPVAVRRRRAA